MKSRRCLACILLLASLTSCASSESRSTAILEPVPSLQTPEETPATTKAFDYPTPRREQQVDNYHGTDVLDAYRWLEDPDSEETKAWVEAENKVTFSYLQSIPERTAIRDRLTALWNYEKFGTPYKQGGRYFYSRNDGLQNQSVQYWAESLKAEPKVLIDPNTLSDDGTVALAGTRVSEDGKHVAYGLQAAGSDWAEWHVRNIDTGLDLDDKLEWIKFSTPRWDKKSTGFYYGRYPQPREGAGLTDANFNQKIYFHKLGTAQSADKLVFETPDHPKWSSGASVSEDGRYLLVEVSKGTGPVNQIHYQVLGAKNAPIVPLISEFEAMYNFLGNQGPVFWFHTDKDAPRGRIIAIDTRKPAPEHWKEIVPQSEATLEGANLIGGKLVTTYLRDAYSEIIIRDLRGKQLEKVALPGIGSAGGFGGKSREMETFYSFSNFITPQTIYRYDFKTGKSSLFKQPEVDFDPDLYEIKQIFYASKDGTKVPMFITHKKGLQLSGLNPTLLYGYGGFNISLTPSFSVDRLAWLEMGGVLAIPSLRGGGEYGEEWHAAGTKLQKQNVFDDFIAAAEYLVANKYTNPGKLAISGRSNGGLLVGAAMTQRPELFGAALPGVGVLDMLRFHKFTIGWAWIDDYGSSDDAEEFKALNAYSPYHNLKALRYPATLVTTADHDDRVVPAHSFKFAAELQRLHTGNNPVMIRIETKAGHGAGKPTSKKIEDIADNYSFLVETLGMRKDRQPRALADDKGRVSIRALAQYLLTQIYPATCAACDLRVAERTGMCALCSESCEAIDTACPTCALPIAGGVAIQCARCVQRGLGLDSCTAVFEYGGQLRVALMRLKFGGRSDIGRSLCPLLASPFAIVSRRCDLALAMPLHKSRLRQRGYNQCQRLLMPLAAPLHLPVSRVALRRIRSTPAQARLDAKERKANLSGAFAAGEQVRDQRVLLLDDILTTGETMRAAARSLRQAGAREVHGFVVARAEARGP